MEERKPKNKPFLLEVWDYLKVRKKWWLLPIIILLILVGALLYLGTMSLSPYVYALW